MKTLLPIQTPRLVFAPFEYPYAQQAALRQHQAHWLHLELSTSSDVHDWKTKMSDSEKRIVGNILKGFTQAECLVGRYWGTLVPKWFPKPEMGVMGTTFASFEAIHAMAYAHLNTTLGLENFDAFLYEPTARAKFDAMIDVPEDGELEDILVSLAVYSGFVEGVSLFSSFAVLLSFAQRNLLKSLGQIISWSIRDESLHSEAGCWLFRTAAGEAGKTFAKKIETRIVEAARLIESLEANFIEMVFAEGELPNVTRHDLLNLIRHRTNTKLGDLGVNKKLFEIDQLALRRMSWFDAAAAGVEHQDFFANRVSTYSKGATSGDWANAF